MSFFDRFRHKKSEERSASTGRVTGTVHDKNVENMIPPHDEGLEHPMHFWAREPLDGELEAFAQQIAALLVAEDRSTGEELLRYEERIHTIGERLCAAWGHSGVQRVAYRAEFVAGLGKGPWIRLLERDWDGLCGWNE